MRTDSAVFRSFAARMAERYGRAREYSDRCETTFFDEDGKGRFQPCATLWSSTRFTGPSVVVFEHSMCRPPVTLRVRLDGRTLTLDSDRTTEGIPAFRHLRRWAPLARWLGPSFAFRVLSGGGTDYTVALLTRHAKLSPFRAVRRGRVVTDSTGRAVRFTALSSVARIPWIRAGGAWRDSVDLGDGGAILRLRRIFHARDGTRVLQEFRYLDVRIVDAARGGDGG